MAWTTDQLIELLRTMADNEGESVRSAACERQNFMDEEDVLLPVQGAALSIDEVHELLAHSEQILRA